MTLTIQVGNSDDGLKQSEWAEFVHAVGSTIAANADVVHFSGGSTNNAPWQNYAWVTEIPEERITSFRDRLVEIRTKYRQDSVALTEGQTYFV